MTKIQKVWIWLLAAIFVVPEIIWSPITKIFVSLNEPTDNGHYKVFRQNFLDNYNNIGLWNGMVLLQLLGIIFLFIYLLFLRKRFNNKFLFWIAELVLLFFGIFVFYYYSLSTIKITF